MNPVIIIAIIISIVVGIVFAVFLIPSMVMSKSVKKLHGNYYKKHTLSKSAENYTLGNQKNCKTALIELMKSKD
jgi:hypothetical protein